jgi:Domain of unknown function (DUF1998)
MSKDSKREIRRMSTITPFGVGAVWESEGESFIAMDISRWRDPGSPIILERLAVELNVSGLRSPTTASVKGSEGMPFYRFPHWHFCQRCRKMSTYDTKKREEVPKCGSCKAKPTLVPMRFVGMCTKGHIFDIDWRYWAHSGPTGVSTCHSNSLKWSEISGGIGLEALSVKCESCSSSRNLGSLMKSNPQCPGRHPWQESGFSTPCDGKSQVSQRGNSSIWFSSTASALDIPPESDWKEDDEVAPAITTDRLFLNLLDQAPGGFFEKDEIRRLATKHNVSIEVVTRLLEIGRKGSASNSSRTTASLRVGEWAAFHSGKTKDERSRFVIEPEDLSPVRTGFESGSLPKWTRTIQQVVRVKRLREVRALIGFTRIEEAGDNCELVPASLDPSVNWLPAYEVYGEGIFITLNEDQLKEWEAKSEVIDRIQKLTSGAANLTRNPNVANISPRLYLLHTLSHLLVRQLAFEAGYPSASLRERLYLTEENSPTDMAGVLIYTAASDSIGSMGGLARQTNPGHLISTIAGALRSASWCSLDPVCSESRSGERGLNQAACHACALAPETSCEMSNLYLDRSLLVHPNYGFMR